MACRGIQMILVKRSILAELVQQADKSAAGKPAEAHEQAQNRLQACMHATWLTACWLAQVIARPCLLPCSRPLVHL